MKKLLILAITLCSLGARADEDAVYNVWLSTENPDTYLETIRGQRTLHRDSPDMDEAYARRLAWETCIDSVEKSRAKGLIVMQYKATFNSLVETGIKFYERRCDLRVLRRR